MGLRTHQCWGGRLEWLMPDGLVEEGGLMCWEGEGRVGTLREAGRFGSDTKERIGKG